MQTAQIKRAFIKHTHSINPSITLAVFLLECDDDIEVAEWIKNEYAHEYPQHIQVWMQDIIAASVKRNAGTGAVVDYILNNIAELEACSREELLERIKTPAQANTMHAHAQAEQATADLLAKLKLH